MHPLNCPPLSLSFNPFCFKHKLQKGTLHFYRHNLKVGWIVLPAKLKLGHAKKKNLKSIMLIFSDNVEGQKVITNQKRRNFCENMRMVFKISNFSTQLGGMSSLNIHMRIHSKDPA